MLRISIDSLLKLEIENVILHLLKSFEGENDASYIR